MYGGAGEDILIDIEGGDLYLEMAVLMVFVK